MLDWKNPDSYTSIITTETPKNVCAWEFLRRNPEYQYDYFEYARTGRFPFYIPYGYLEEPPLLVFSKITNIMNFVAARPDETA